MKLPDFLFDISKWGAFKIPAISIGSAALLLIFRDANKPDEMLFIQSVIKFSIGSAVIAYCQSLSYSTYCLNRDKSDLPIYIQTLFMAAQIGWFSHWYIAQYT